MSFFRMPKCRHQTRNSCVFFTVSSKNLWRGVLSASSLKLQASQYVFASPILEWSFSLCAIACRLQACKGAVQEMHTSQGLRVSIVKTDLSTALQYGNIMFYLTCTLPRVGPSFSPRALGPMRGSGSRSSFSGRPTMCANMLASDVLLLRAATTSSWLFLVLRHHVCLDLMIKQQLENQCFQLHLCWDQSQSILLFRNRSSGIADSWSKVWSSSLLAWSWYEFSPIDSFVEDHSLIWEHSTL